MGLMDIQVEATSIGVARIEVDIGGGHTLKLRASYNGDRFTDIALDWDLPAIVTGPRRDVRDRKTIRLVRTTLDQQARTRSFP